MLLGAAMIGLGLLLSSSQGIMVRFATVSSEAKATGSFVGTAAISTRIAGRSIVIAGPWGSWDERQFLVLVLDQNDAPRPTANAGILCCTDLGNLAWWVPGARGDYAVNQTGKDDLTCSVNIVSGSRTISGVFRHTIGGRREDADAFCQNYRSQIDELAANF
jgi:hypothetical protein